MRATNLDFMNGRCIKPPEAYPEVIRNKPALILGDGNHRAGLSLANDLDKIDIVLRLMPQFTLDRVKILSILALAKKHWDILKGLV